MYIKNLFLHTALILRHKWRVFVNCAKCGLVFRGIVHDLSKFSPTEFFESVKYYQGDRSPIGVCRRQNGVSHAWLHHKGRNRHHIEYWLDGDCPVTPLMPYKYAVECICDKLAATHVYAGRNFSNDLPLIHYRKYGNKVEGNPRTMEFVDAVFVDVEKHGEKYVLNSEYLKKKYKEICG